MDSRVTSLFVAAVMAAAFFTPPHPACAGPAQEKRPAPPPQTTVPPTRPADPASGPAGAPAELDDLGLAAQTDSTILRMQGVITEAQALSKSFSELAALHHGADRSEILMMQRMSDAMATMGGEVVTTLRQYKAMLDDETVSDTGAMKAEVQELRAAIVVMAGEVAEAVKTLHRLQGQLGQG